MKRIARMLLAALTLCAVLSSAVFTASAVSVPSLLSGKNDIVTNASDAEQWDADSIGGKKWESIQLRNRSHFR